MKGTFCIFGGGTLGTKETLALDKYNVSLTKKKHPKALFIPTASGDAERYCELFRKTYTALGCKTDELLLLRERHTRKNIVEKILGANLIYVGGGNTLRMMKRWKQLRIDKLLTQARDKGTVLSGLSAGGICFFEHGHSDSRKFSGNPHWKFIRVAGLRMLPGIHTPHFDDPLRKKDFPQFMMNYAAMGIALDNGAALIVRNNMARLLSTKKHAKGYKVFRKDHGVIIEELPQRWFPFLEIYSKR